MTTRRVHFVGDWCPFALAIALIKDTVEVFFHVVAPEPPDEEKVLPPGMSIRWYSTWRQLGEGVKEISRPSDLIFYVDHFSNLGEAQQIRAVDLGARLELDRGFAAMFIKKLAPWIKIPRTTTDPDKAQMFPGDKVVVKFDENQYVVKQRFPGNSIRTMVLYKRDLFLKTTNFQGAVYQEFIEGEEVGFGGFMGAEGKFLQPFTMIQEYKRRYPKQIRSTEMTGESGSCGQFMTWTELDQLSFPIGDLMRAHEVKIRGHVGFFDINCMVTPDGEMYFLEYTTRMPHPTEAQVAACAFSYTELLFGLWEGMKEFPVRSKYFASVLIKNGIPALQYLVSTPPQDTNKWAISNTAGITKNGHFLASEASEDICLVTAFGQDIPESVKNLYECTTKIEGAGVYYLTDVGADWNPIKSVMCQGVVA